VIQPVKSYNFAFVADGTSTSLTLDLSVLPVLEDFRGAVIESVLAPAATSTFTGALVVTAAVVGTVLTLTFSVAPPEFDGSNNRITYTASFTLAFGA
jgi:hypothetical protein